MKGLQQLMRFLYEKGGSDLHLKENSVPRVRLNGDLIALESRPIDRRTLRSWMEGLLEKNRFERFLRNGQIDFAWEWENVARFRCNYYFDRMGLGAVFRLIPENVVPFEKLGIPNVVLNFAKQPSGLILVTGPTGSGKSTTLAAMVDHLNATQALHIITIEDPIEFVHKRKKSYITQREVGIHTGDFSSALRASLREDPDVLLVGELREQETTALALMAAEMGFLVMATLHTGSAGATVTRIVDMFPAGRRRVVYQQLANTLNGVVSQTLFKRTGGRGRAAAAEILVATRQLRSLVREGLVHQIPSAFQQGVSAGCQTMDQAIFDLVRRGTISKEDALYKLEDKTVLDQLRGGSARGKARTNVNARKR